MKSEQPARDRGDKGSLGERAAGAGRANIMAAAQIIFGIVIFSAAWWVPEESRQTAFYIFGFITVLIGILSAVMLAPKS
ncbi:MAG: hypothetical protein IBX61_01680 [Thermoleophilia bacterium]|nr:hypothetical protein [Thermoleophilia bacterium]